MNSENQEKVTDLTGKDFIKAWYPDGKLSKEERRLFKKMAAKRLFFGPGYFESNFMGSKPLKIALFQRLVACFPIFKKHLLASGIEIQKWGIELKEDEESVLEIGRISGFICEDNTIYFGRLSKEIAKAKKTITVYDYLGRSENEGLIEEEDFLKSQKLYLDNLTEKFILDTSITYNRILTLPEIGRIEYTSNPAIVEALRKSFHNTLKHIFKCMTHKDIDKKGDIGKSRFNLYVCSNPAYLHSFANIDNQTILLENDRYDERGVAHPSTLMIYQKQKMVHASINDLVDYYVGKTKWLLTKGKDSEPPVFGYNLIDVQQGAEILFRQKKTELEKLKKEAKEAKERHKKDLSDVAKMETWKEIFEKKNSKEKEFELIKNKAKIFLLSDDITNGDGEQ